MYSSWAKFQTLHFWQLFNLDYFAVAVMPLTNQQQHKTKKNALHKNIFKELKSFS